MTLTILGIVASVVTFVLWLARRKVESQTPEKQYIEELQKADNLIATRNEDKINTLIDDSLRDIESRGLRDVKREDNSSGQSGS